MRAYLLLSFQAASKSGRDCAVVLGLRFKRTARGWQIVATYDYDGHLKRRSATLPRDFAATARSVRTYSNGLEYAWQPYTEAWRHGSTGKTLSSIAARSSTSQVVVVETENYVDVLAYNPVRGDYSTMLAVTLNPYGGLRASGARLDHGGASRGRSPDAL